MSRISKDSEPRILLISRHDSFTKLAVRYSLLLKQKGWNVKLLILNPKLVPKRILSSVVSTLDNADIPIVQASDVDIKKYDALFFLITGGILKKISIDWGLQNPDRPFIISTYPGLIYQNIFDGFVSRSLCDLILLPSEFDLQNYYDFCRKFDLKPVAVKCGFFGNLGCDYIHGISQEDFVFSEQSVAPNAVIERKYLSKKLIDFANTIAPKRLYISERVKEGEPTLFGTKFSIVDGIESIGKPENLIFTNQPALSLIRSGASSLTVSSTVGVEALEFTDRSYFIKDFGPSEQVGGDFFVDSGTYISFEDLIQGKRPTVDAEWKRQHYEQLRPEFINKVFLELIRSPQKYGIENYAKLISEELAAFPHSKIPSQKPAHKIGRWLFSLFTRR